MPYARDMTTCLSTTMRGLVTMEEWNKFLNKPIKIIFDDGLNHFSKKEGILTDVTATHLILQITDWNEAVNLRRIIRVEEIKNGNKGNIG